MEITNKLFSYEKMKSTVIGLYKLDIYSFSKSINNCILKEHNNKNRFRNISNKKKCISIIDSSKIEFHTKTVKDELRYVRLLNKVKKMPFDDTLKKIFETLDLDLEILNRKIKELSRSELYKLYLSINTMINKDVYIFNDFTRYLDKNGIKSFLKLIDILKANDKVIFIADSDINVMYNYTKSMIYEKNDKLYLLDTSKALTDVDILIKEDLPIPTLVKITYLARNEKNVRLSYHKDVRDIMKDIYKHI